MIIKAKHKVTVETMKFNVQHGNNGTVRVVAKATTQLLARKHHVFSAQNKADILRTLACKKGRRDTLMGVDVNHTQLYQNYNKYHLYLKYY